MNYTDQHKYSKYATASYVNYEYKKDVLKDERTLHYLHQEFPDHTFEILESNDNDVVIYDKTNNEIIVSYRGTQQLSDWTEENLPIAINPESNTQGKRFQTALELAKKYKDAYPDIPIKTTGHSMGSIAIGVAQLLDIESHAYDPAISSWNAKQKGGKINIYRPKTGGIVSAKSYLMKNMDNVNIYHVDLVKHKSNSLVDHHDLIHYDDREKDRHKGIMNNFNTTLALRKDVKMFMDHPGTKILNAILF